MSLMAVATGGGLTASDAPSPYGSSPGLTSDGGGRDAGPNHARKTWKAYHERQALIAAERQYGRPVQVDPMLWGDLLRGKLEELIEGERNHPRNVVRGGAADRDGGHCLLPDLDDARFRTGHDRAVAAAVGKPRWLRFSEEGAEYTADNFGSGGGFSEMYQRRYDGFNARVKEAGGLAAERAWSRAGRPTGKAGEGHRERRSKEKKDRDAQTIPWTVGTPQAVASLGSGGNGRSASGGGGGERASGDGRRGSAVSNTFGDDLFASDADSVLWEENGGGRRDRSGDDLEAHPSAHIGPDTHTFDPEEVEVVHQARDEEKAEGSNTSLAAQMEHRLVPMGAGTGAARKLRGTAARERQEQARIVTSDQYREGALRRDRHACSKAAKDDGDGGGGGGGSDDDDSTLCSVTAFEGHYTKTTQAADALPAVEKMLNDDERPGIRRDSATSDERPSRAEGAAAAAAPPPPPPTAEAIERGQRREERRAERRAKLEEKRAWEREERSSSTVDGSSRTVPGGMLVLRYPQAGGRGSFRDAGDDVSLAPSMSSLGSFDERSGSAPRLSPEPAFAGATGAPDGRPPADSSLPPAIGRTFSSGGKLPSVRRRSSNAHTGSPFPPIPATALSGGGGGGGGGGDGGEGGEGVVPDSRSSACSVERTAGVCPDTPAPAAAVVPAEREGFSSLSGIAFRGTGKRRRSRGGNSSSSNSGGGGSGGSGGGGGTAFDPHAAVTHATKRRPSLGVVIGDADAEGIGSGESFPGSAPEPSTTTIATAAGLQGKVAGWRRRLTKPVVPSSRMARPRSSSPPASSGADRASRSDSAGSPAPRAIGKATAEDRRRPRHRKVLPPPAGRRGARVSSMDEERAPEGSATTSLAAPSGSARDAGTVAAELAAAIPPRSEAGVSVATSSASPFSTLGAGTVAGGSAVFGSAATAGSGRTGRTASTASMAAGLSGTGLEGGDGEGTIFAAGQDRGGIEGGAAGRRRGAHGGEEMATARKKRRGGGGGDGDGGKAKRVHKIHLGSQRQQRSMTPAERTALLIGACEWGDLEALERLLELGASPLDPYSSSSGQSQSRCVLCQFFVFLLQVGAGLRPRLAPDDALHDRALSLLIEAGLEDSPRFLLNPRLRDRDKGRGFCLLHHAAAFGNVSKVEFLLRRGVEPDDRAEGGDETALMVAARRGQRLHLRVAAALIQAGANMLARDRKGMTALHHAAEVGRKHMCHYLLLVGADKTVQDGEGRTPMDLCRTTHPRAFAALRSFVRSRPPPGAILDYMEKVEVQGLKPSAAKEKMLLERVERHQQDQRNAATVAASSAAAAAAAAAADVVLGGGGGDSLASWDAASLDGMSGAGASVLSLGSLVPVAAAAATRAVSR